MLASILLLACKYVFFKIHCERSRLGLVFFAYQFMIYELFCALKTMLSKLKNLGYLRSKKVNFDPQHCLHCTKKLKNHESN